MADILPPKQVQLDLSKFPNEPWAKYLVDAINTFAVQTQQAIQSVPKETLKTLKFRTGGTVANSFPIDIPVGGPLSTVRVAQVVRGGTLAGSAVSVQWTMLSGGRLARITLITGLSPSTSYEIKLAYL